MKKKFLFLILTLIMMMSLIPLGGITVKAETVITGLQQTYADTGSIHFKWDSVIGVSKYDVQASEDNVNWKNVDLTYGSQARVNGLNAGRSYYVRVSAANENNYSAPLEVTTACEKVTNLGQISATTSSVTLAWDAVAGATSYQVCSWQNSQEYPLMEVTTTTCTLDGFSNALAFPCNLYVKPVRSISGYIAGKEAVHYTKAAYILSTNIKLVPQKAITPVVSHYYNNSQRAWVDFSPGVFADGSEYELYNTKDELVSQKDTGSYGTVDAAAKEFYKIRVRDYTYVGSSKTPIYGEWSDFTYFTNNPKLSLKKSGSNIKVSWKKNSRAANYTIYASTSLKGTYKKVATTNKTSYTVKKVNKKKLKKGKTYYFYVVTNLKVGKTTYKSGGDTAYYIKK